MPLQIEIAPGVYIGDGHAPYIIAEIGQNHQGDLDVAKRMIVAAKESGADCVKFQKTDINAKFTMAALQQPYAGGNSWGETYAQHKNHLEFTLDEFRELKSFCTQHEITFTASAMDTASVDVLCDDLCVAFLKIGSGDANNFPLIQHAAKKHIPLIISTGMQSMDVVRAIHAAVTREHTDLVLMHCVSAYPLPLAEINLRVLQTYQRAFPNTLVGYSGHELGTDICAVAVALGATVIERHFTLDHHQRGSDHVCSLTPPQFRKMVVQIERVRMALGDSAGVKRPQVCELPCSQKLGKSVVMTTCRPAGHALTSRDVGNKVAQPQGVNAAHLHRFIGKTLRRDLHCDQCVLYTDLCEDEDSIK